MVKEKILDENQKISEYNSAYHVAFKNFSTSLLNNLKNLKKNEAYPYGVEFILVKRSEFNPDYFYIVLLYKHDSIASFLISYSPNYYKRRKFYRYGQILVKFETKNISHSISFDRDILDKKDFKKLLDEVTLYIFNRTLGIFLIKNN